MVRWVKRVGVNASALFFCLHFTACQSVHDTLVTDEQAYRGPMRKNGADVVTNLPIIWIDVLSRGYCRPSRPQRVAIKVVAW